MPDPHKLPTPVDWWAVTWRAIGCRSVVLCRVDRTLKAHHGSDHVPEPALKVLCDAFVAWKMANLASMPRSVMVSTPLGGLNSSCAAFPSSTPTRSWAILPSWPPTGSVAKLVCSATSERASGAHLAAPEAGGPQPLPITSAGTAFRQSDRPPRHQISCLSPLIKIGHGPCQAIAAMAATIKQWRQSLYVETLAGDPATVRLALIRAMGLSVSYGFYEMAKGGIKIGTLIASAVEMVVKSVLRIRELRRIRHFFDSAASYWFDSSTDQCLHKYPVAFNAWFSGHAMETSCLAARALNSGCFSSMMSFLKRFLSPNIVISQSVYDAGLACLGVMKIAGARHLEYVGYRFSNTNQGDLAHLPRCTAPSLAIMPNHRSMSGLLHAVIA